MLYLAGQILAFVLVALVLGAVLAWVLLIGPMRRGRATVAAGGASPPRADLVVGSSGEALSPKDGADGVQEAAEAPSGAVGLARLDEDRLGALTDWLRRREERDLVENAELVTRLAAAERQAGDSERRLAAAERQTTEAIEQVGAAQARITQIEAELRGVASDERETRQLRTALAEAETRAARFSARLAIMRTEAEEAAHQVAAVTERMEHRQAEWTAERADLLVRIAEAEAIAAAWTAGEPESPAGYADLTVDELADPAALVGAQGMHGQDMAAGAAGSPMAREDSLAPSVSPDRPVEPMRLAVGVMTPAGGSSTGGQGPSSDAALVGAGAARHPASAVDTATLDTVDTATLDTVVQEILDADAIERDARADQPEPGAGDQADSSPADPAPACPIDDAVPAGLGEPIREIGDLPGSPGPAGDPTLEAPAWGGLAEPVASTDNLREIVGIGPVIETRLRTLGVTSFRQLAAMGDTDVERLSARLDGFGSRIVSDDWVGQARELQERYHGGL
ncbi:hypothetical protein I6A84_41695 [Frankia sp. CNm7]|uniref:Uncharacterized protein n=1 Tax=Frankia nepalensis TaxID=1836974 RepID=A0A937RBL6_9ACTN|nr:hypothetical protein [Frankia nepalensis]MBL7499131.1 hypothetical protein [Frankia nepalensis]MBL7515161.1 hypothetical protein [Frankia nepalensis]MBL7524382.1 hypothetical protein [Frankia nepalensis]MBL7625924.1 hypothetical protein [Frankia nepalensis]